MQYFKDKAVHIVEGRVPFLITNLLLQFVLLKIFILLSHLNHLQITVSKMYIFLVTQELQIISIGSNSIMGAIAKHFLLPNFISKTYTTACWDIFLDNKTFLSVI